MTAQALLLCIAPFAVAWLAPGMIVYMLGVHVIQVTYEHDTPPAVIVPCPWVGVHVILAELSRTVCTIVRELCRRHAKRLREHNLLAQSCSSSPVRLPEGMSGDSEEMEEVWADSPEPGGATELRPTGRPIGPPPPRPIEVEQPLAHRISRAVARELQDFVGPVLCYIPWGHVTLTSMRITIEPMRGQDRMHPNVLQWGTEGPREDELNRPNGPAEEDRQLSYSLSAAIGDVLGRRGRLPEVVLTRLTPEVVAPRQTVAMLTANIRRMAAAEAMDELALWTGSPTPEEGREDAGGEERKVTSRRLPPCRPRSLGPIASPSLT